MVEHPARDVFFIALGRVRKAHYDPPTIR